MVRSAIGVGCVALVCALIGWCTEPAAYADRASDPQYEIDFGENETEKESHIDASKFPSVTVRFRILDKATRKPAENLPNAEVVIFEDGQEVKRMPVQSSGPASAMLVLDTSGSMVPDQKMQRAKEAAGDFFTKLNREVDCGLVLFNHKVYESLSPTRERNGLERKVVAAKAEGGTAYFDATAAAIRQLRDVRGRKAIVLMTDGRDTNSRQFNLDKVIAEAKSTGVQVYTVGLGKPGANYPVRLALVLDCSGSMREGPLKATKFDRMKEASTAFIEFLRKDKIVLDKKENLAFDAAEMTILPFASRVGKAAPLTNSEPKLKSVLNDLQAIGDTALYDATCEGIRTLDAATLHDKARLEERGKGIRRSVVVLTDGKDTSSGNSEQGIIAQHKRTGIRVYMLGLGDPRLLNEPLMKQISKDCGGEYFAVPDSAALARVMESLSIQLNDDGIDEESLGRLASETGGQYFHVENADKLAEQFKNIAGYLESYSATYESKRTRKDGLGRSILIKFGDYAEARTGFGLHGMLTPAYDSIIYLIFLVLIGGLLAVPMVWRRRSAAA